MWGKEDSIMKKTIFLCLIAFAAFCVHAQSAESVSDLLESEKANMGQLSYLCASKLGVISEDTSYADALDVLKKEGIVRDSKKITAETPVRMGELSFVLSKTWDIEGSLFYKINKSKRYAFMQCKALGIIPSSVSGIKIASGRDVLNAITMCNNLYPGKSEGEAK